MAFENFIFNLSGSPSNPFFSTTKITNSSGPPSTGATLIAAVSMMLSSARSQTRSISTELVCISRKTQDFKIQKLVQAFQRKHSDTGEGHSRVRKHAMPKAYYEEQN